MRKIGTFNLETNSNEVRDMTAEELAQYEIDKAEGAQTKADRLAKEAAKREVYSKLGLSSDEIDLILPPAVVINSENVSS